MSGRQAGLPAQISYADADYFNVSANDERIAKAVRTRPVPSLDDIRMALAAMPTTTVLERRDRAVVAFALASGARDNAIASLVLRHASAATPRTTSHHAPIMNSELKPQPRQSKRARNPNRRSIKIHRNYTVEEAARVTGCAKGTIRPESAVGLLRTHAILSFRARQWL
jgi:hypothetical protein